MKVKTDELTDLALNWAVAKAIGEYKPVAVPHYSTNWSQGGPIIEREEISVMMSFRDSYAEGANAKPSGWCARKYQYGVLNEPLSYGPTPLIAAMRCFVASHLGDEVDVPEELE